jgi:hypothetical protein
LLAALPVPSESKMIRLPTRAPSERKSYGLAAIPAALP